MACIGMAIGFVAMCLGHPPWWVIAMVGAMEVCVLIYLLSRPEGPAPTAALPAVAESAPIPPASGH
jgi:hypothetical protein